MKTFEFLKKLSSIQEKIQFPLTTKAKEKDPKKGEEFIKYIIEGKDEREIFQKLYPSERSKDKVSFNKLKNRTIEKLLIKILQGNLYSKNASNLQKSYSSSYKMMAVIKLLYGFGERNLSIWLSEKLLKTAKKYWFIDIKIELLKLLKIHYGVIAGNKSYLSKYYKEHKEALKEYISEKEVEDVYIEIIHQFTYSRKNLYSNPIDKYLEELTRLKPHNLKPYSPKYISQYTVSMVILYMIKKEYQEAINLCKAILFHLENHSTKKQYFNKIITIYTFKIQILIHLKKFNEAGITFDKLSGIKNIHLSNQFSLKELNLIIFLRSDKYQEAYELFLEVSNQKGFHDLPPLSSEAWKLYGAYLEFLVKAGKIDKEKVSGNLPKRKFRLAKFLNEVPTFSKDKRRMNISILIIQILVLLADRKYGAIIDRMDALSAYSYRYLRKNMDLYRSQIFIKLLQLIPKSDFHHERVGWRSNNLMNKLRESPEEISFQNTEIEVIPYETLWEFVLELLSDKQKRLKNRTA